MRKSKNARTKQKLAQKAAQKKRRRGKSKDRGQGQTLAPTFHMLRHPFEGLSDDQRRSAIEEIARNSEEKYQEALSELKAILRRHHPLLVLSHMSSYGLSVAIDETAGLTKRDGDYEMFPYHVEILQALLLQIPPEELSGKPFGPQVLTQVWDQVKTLCDAHNFRQIDPAGVQLRDDEMAVALAQQLMRSATQAVRNWGYPSQIKRIARELYCPFDARLLEAQGFSASDVFDVFETMVTQVESRQSFHLNTLVNLFRSSGTDGRLLVENYHELIGLEKEKAEQFVDDLNVEETALDRVRSMIRAHYNLRLPEVYTFLATDLADTLDLDEDRVSAVLDQYALPLGALSDYETEHLHLSNPVKGKSGRLLHRPRQHNAAATVAEYCSADYRPTCI